MTDSNTDKPYSRDTDKRPEHKRQPALTDLSLRAASELRKRLGIDDDRYHFTYGPNASDPRSYYVYGALNEIEKAGIAMMMQAEYIRESRAQGAPADLKGDDLRLADNVIQHDIDESSLWQRKLTEVMVDAIGFRGANLQEYFQHYLVLHELQALRRVQADIKEYYGAHNKNYEFQQRDLEERADQLAAKFDRDKCWYAKVEKGKITRKLQPFDVRFNRVFVRMSKAQKAILRTHYVTVGSQSKMLHPQPLSSAERNLKLDDLESHLWRVGTLSIYAVVALKDLMRIHNVKGVLKAAADIVKRNDYPIDLHRKRTSPDIEIGDYVLAGGELCQVTKVIRSKYGYKSFRVKYVDREPLPGIPEDEFIGELVQLYQKRGPLVKQVKSLLQQEVPGIEPSTRAVNRALLVTIKEIWANGGRDYAHGRQQEGVEKLMRHAQHKMDSFRKPKKR